MIFQKASASFRANTALAVSEMLEMVAQPGGTATQAQINGYRVAGKTGTAHKLEGNGYAKNRYLSTFVGYAPASNPAICHRGNAG